MATITKHPGTITQTTGGKFRDFKNLNNIKNTTTGSYAVSNGNIRGKSGSPNRPSTLTLKNFGFNLPTGAEVTKVTVTYRHKKTGSGGHTLNIPAPTLTLLGTGSNTFTKKGAAPTTSMVTHTYSVSTSKITRTQVNSSNFGVKIDYPTNTNSYEGTVSISYVRVAVEYKTSSYNVSVKNASGPGYNGEDYTVQLNISNKNLTNYNPTLTLTTPLGFNYDSYDGDGTITQVNSRTFTWNPGITAKTGTRSVNLTFGTNVTFPTGSDTYTGTFTLVESLNSTTANHTATITRKPTTPEEETETGEEIIDDEGLSFNIQFVRKGEPFKLAMKLTEEERTQLFTSNKMGILNVFPNPGFEEETFNHADKLSWYNPDDTMSNNRVVQEFNVDENGNIIWSGGQDSIYFDDYTGVTFPTEISVVLFQGTATSSYVEDSDYIVRNLKINVAPKETQLTPPYLSLLTPSEEELNRLGSGYTYIAQTYMEHTTTDSYERDWYKNNRIGVFNNAIQDNITIVEEEDPETGEIIEIITDSTDYDNLTPADIFTYAEYWSSALTNIGEYENLECEFTYNKNYPLYILLTGDYPEAETYDYDVGEVSFTEPCIIEKEVYKEREPNGKYPAPILDLIDYEETEDTATITLGAYESGSSVILYDLPLEEGYGTNDDLAIRGVQVRATIESTDNIVVYAKLKTPDGNIGQRSLVLDDMDTVVDSGIELVIGGLGDLWGFNTLDMVNLEDWEIELSATNLLSNEDSTLNFSDVKIVFFVETVDKQTITVKIEDENLAYYGAFIENVVIPEGLETDTSFLTIDGTDMNDAYRQNIKEKTIELEFSLNDCDLQTNTDMLRQIAKLIVNEKDQYNRPIPKKIEFSHYPTDYFEYIVKDAFDVTEDLGGYHVKVDLVIPAGTSYSKDDIVTNTTGYVQGLAAVRPIITFKPSDEIINITETVSQQSFNMGYSGDWNSKIVEIDCDNRRVFLKGDEDDPNPVDISRYVDYNVDWFRLHGEFSFDTTNCVIRTVSFNERW